MEIASPALRPAKEKCSLADREKRSARMGRKS